jgi:hypothetical protein
MEQAMAEMVAVVDLTMEMHTVVQQIQVAVVRVVKVRVQRLVVPVLLLFIGRNKCVVKMQRI